MLNTEESRAETMACQATPPELEYGCQPWGDCIYGTKEQLQSIGLGVGTPFPGEEGEPRKKIKVTDPRGFTATISYFTDGIFNASIRFPGRERPKEDEWKPFYFGVRKRERCSWYDEYIGTAEALVAAGLVRDGQFPGMPGMRKVCVTILPDGTLPTGSPTANCSKAKEPGAKWIEKKAKGTYCVSVCVQEDEKDRRQEKNKREELEWEKRMAALPRPEPLHVSGKQIPPAKKKESYYSSPESFKKFALNFASREGGGFEFVFGGEHELDEYGEITMKLDDQSRKEIASVYAEMNARLAALVSAAKVVRVRPYLSVVK